MITACTDLMARQFGVRRAAGNNELDGADR